ncbi:MAG: PhnD/SsuA/transferrin family substrate-binding protein [Halothiobacillaceae bacterium]|nr:PhnD/SsuA/transferrin family substrate-binding protein [Halothiobacillaceae bacterium]
MNLTPFALGVALLCLSLPAQAELTLSGLPFDKDPTEQNKNYVALAAQLSQALGEDVRYVPSANILGYAQAIRRGEYDILVDGPHFSAWRIAEGLHSAVVQADITLTYAVVTAADDTGIQSLEQLVSQPVCASSPPQLSTLMLLNQYPNPIQEPTLHITDGYLMTASPKLTVAKRTALTKRLSTANPANDSLLQALTKASVHNGEPEKMHWSVSDTGNIKGLEKILIKQSYGW